MESSGLCSLVFSSPVLYTEIEGPLSGQELLGRGSSMSTMMI